VSNSCAEGDSAETEASVPIIFVHGGGQLGVGWSSAYNSQLRPLNDPSNSVRAQSFWAAIMVLIA
jgi:hypothetical protein